MRNVQEKVEENFLVRVFDRATVDLMKVYHVYQVTNVPTVGKLVPEAACVRIRITWRFAREGHVMSPGIVIQDVLVHSKGDAKQEEIVSQI
jgi:hypothetical protein